MNWLDQAIGGVRDHDWSRPRSVQTEIGWSEAGGCRARLGYRIMGAFPEQTDTWAAQRGTALHDYLVPILARQFGGRAEVRTKYRGIPGHADILEPNAVTDLKTTTLDTSATWQAKLTALRPKRIQAHGYAAGFVDTGELPPDCKVRLLVVPVDGTFADWWVYEEPFDRNLADEGANRVEWVREQVAAGLPLDRDMPPTWCAKWCGFAPLCRPDGPGKDEALPLISDPVIAAAVDRYGELHLVASPAEAEKKKLAPLLRGLEGRTPDGWKVATSKAGDAGEEPDMEAIEVFFAEHGAEVPVREKPGSSPRLSVTRIKDKPRGDGE